MNYVSAITFLPKSLQYSFEAVLKHEPSSLQFSTFLPRERDLLEEFSSVISVLLKHIFRKFSWLQSRTKSVEVLRSLVECVRKSHSNKFILIIRYS